MLLKNVVGPPTADWAGWGRGASLLFAHILAAGPAPTVAHEHGPGYLAQMAALASGPEKQHPEISVTVGRWGLCAWSWV